MEFMQYKRDAVQLGFVLYPQRCLDCVTQFNAGLSTEQTCSTRSSQNIEMSTVLVVLSDSYIFLIETETVDYLFNFPGGENVFN